MHAGISSQLTKQYVYFIGFSKAFAKGHCFFVNGLDLFNLPFITLDFCINTVLCKDSNNVQGSKKRFANMKCWALPSFTPVDSSETKDSAVQKASACFM